MMKNDIEQAKIEMLISNKTQIYKKLNNLRILITSSNGFTGGYLTSYLTSLGFTVFIEIQFNGL